MEQFQKVKEQKNKLSYPLPRRYLAVKTERADHFNRRALARGYRPAARGGPCETNRKPLATSVPRTRFKGTDRALLDAFTSWGLVQPHHSFFAVED